MTPTSITPPPLHPGACPKMLPMPAAVRSPAARAIEVHPIIDPITRATTGWKVIIDDEHAEEISDIPQSSWDDWNAIAARLVTSPTVSTVTNQSPFNHRPRIIYHGRSLTPFARACRREDFLFPSSRPVKALDGLYDSSASASAGDTPAITTMKNHLTSTLASALTDGTPVDNSHLAALAATEVDLLVQAGVLIPKDIRIRPVLVR